MKVALLDAKQGERDPSKSITVAYRNMLVLAKHLQATLFVSASQLRHADDDFDVIICGFGATSTEREESTKFLQRNRDAKLFWLVGEYEQSTFAPLFYCKREYHVLKNFEHEMKNKQASQQSFVNLNALLATQAPTDDPDRLYGGVYYGRWRNDRSVYFNRYLQGDILLSTSPKNMKVFAAHGCAPRYARAMAWSRHRETLRLFSASLYIEDKFTHTHYNCPANRYYEALQCGVPIVSQPEAAATWDKAGIDVGGWRIVKDAADFSKVANDLKNDKGMRREALLEQSQWAAAAVAERDCVLAKILHLVSGDDSITA